MLAMIATILLASPDAGTALRKCTVACYPEVEGVTECFYEERTKCIAECVESPTVKCTPRVVPLGGW